MFGSLRPDENLKKKSTRLSRVLVRVVFVTNIDAL